ncbi:MAG: transporter [Acidobacteria bacterium]|nr:transporter [Bryobacteraceae bacterium CoA2 C42]
MSWAGLALAAERLPVPGEGGMVTDRPGFSESAAVLGAGMLQWESGFQFGRIGMDGERTTSTVGPYPLLRLGVSRRVELRFTGDGYRREHRGGETVGGMTDFVVGGKVQVWEQGRWRPDLAVVGNVGAVRGGRQYARSGWEPEGKLCAEKDVAGGGGVGGEFQCVVAGGGTREELGAGAFVDGGSCAGRGVERVCGDVLATD